MLTLYQAEWCPFSSAVREILTEFGLDFVARQVEPWPEQRDGLRAVAGTLLPRAGRIEFRGRDITRLPSHERAWLGISLVPEGRRVFPFLTVRENLELGAFKYRKDRARVRKP